MSIVAETKVAEAPVLARWRELKAQHPGKVIGVEMGAFVECFCDDAEAVAKALGIALTSRGRHLGMPIPMCAVTRQQWPRYANRLASAGIAVALVPGELGERGAATIEANAEPFDPSTLTPAERKAVAASVDAAERRAAEAEALRGRITRLIGPHSLGRTALISEGDDAEGLARLVDLAELATLPAPVDLFSVETLDEVGAAIGAAVDRHNVHDLAWLRGSDRAAADAAMQAEMERVEALRRRAVGMPVRSPSEAIVAAGVLRDMLSDLSPMQPGEPLGREGAGLLGEATTLFDTLAAWLLTSTGFTPREAGVECYLAQLAKRAATPPVPNGADRTTVA